MGLKHLGIGICVVGSIVAILFIPCTFLGTFAGWHFILEPIEIFGERVGTTYELIDVSALILELILINGVGLALYFYGKKQESGK